MHIVGVEDQYAFNGSITYHKERLVIFYRIDFSKINVGIIENNKIVKSWLLEGSYNYIDPRVINHNGTLFLSVSNQSQWMADQMEILELDDNLSIKHKIPIKGFKRREKNWIPFIYDDDIYYIYKPSPHTIIKADLATGEITKLHETNWKYPTENFKWGAEWRGSSQAILIEDFYLATIHTEDHYVFFYTFASQPPFEVRKISSQPLFPGAYKDPNIWVHYINGLTLVNDKLILSGGYGLTASGRAVFKGGVGNDRVTIKEYNLNEVLSSLINVNNT